MQVCKDKRTCIRITTRTTPVFCLLFFFNCCLISRISFFGYFWVIPEKKKKLCQQIYPACLILFGPFLSYAADLSASWQQEEAGPREDREVAKRLKESHLYVAPSSYLAPAPSPPTSLILPSPCDSGQWRAHIS